MLFIMSYSVLIVGNCIFLDSIEANVDSAAVHVEDANVQLHKASNYQVFLIISLPLFYTINYMSFFVFYTFIKRFIKISQYNTLKCTFFLM